MSAKAESGAIAARAAASEGRLERLQTWLVPALLVPLVIFHLGYVYAWDNQGLLFPWILRRIDLSLLVNDWFANTIPHHANYIRFLAFAARFAPLPAVTLALHALALFLLLWVANRFAVRLFASAGVFYTALFLFLRWGTNGLGGNGLWADNLVPHNLAVPVCLLAFYLTFLEKPIAAALVAAFATWIHIQLGAVTMLVLGLGMVVEWRHWGLRKIVVTGAVYMAAVAPTLIAQWDLYVAAPSPLSPRAFLNLHAILRQPHHLIPSSWPGADYYRFFLVLGMAALAADWREPRHRRVLIWCAIILALCVAGTVFVEAIPVKLIIKLQLFRMTIFVKFFAVLYAARFLLETLFERGWAQKLCALAILAIQNFAVIGVCALLIAALRQKRLATQQWVWGAGLFLAGCVTGASVVATASLGHPIPMFWHSFAVAPRGVGVGLATLAALAAICWWRAGAIPVALLALAVALRVITGLPFYGYDHPPTGNWYRFCHYIKTSTPRDAVFITPPFSGGFTMYSERAEVADWKNTPSIETDLIEWKHRMDDLAGVADLRCSGFVSCAGTLAGDYSRLREPDFLRLAAKYHAQYIVTSQFEHAGPGRQLSFPEVYRLGNYILYQVPQQTASGKLAPSAGMGGADR